MQKVKTTKTERLLQSFSSVQLRPDHRNYGDETPALRDFGVAPSVATALIRWGEKFDLVCWFESGKGTSTAKAYSWQPAFLIDAVNKHLEMFPNEAENDIPSALREFAATKGESGNPQLASKRR